MASSIKSTSFVELFARSNFSFLQGASFPEEMVQRAFDLGYAGLGLCDLHGLYGVARGHREITTPDYFEKARDYRNFSYHIGCELAFPEASVYLMPSSILGYQTLCRLISKAKIHAPKTYQQLCLDDILSEQAQDLWVFIRPRIEKLYELQPKLTQFQKKFANRLFLIVCRDHTWQSFYLNEELFKLEKMGFSLVASQLPYFHIPERKKLFDILTCIHHRTKIKEAGLRLIQNSHRCLKPLPELEELWQDRLDLLEKTTSIAKQLQFSLSQIRYHYPRVRLPQGFTAIDYLKKLCYQNLPNKFPNGISAKNKAQLEKEFQLIEELQYVDYFLTLWEICEFARSQKILFQGRGSAANSIVCYLLGLTAVDPEKVDLLFERFISKERNEPPDIDIDFQNDRREEVIQYIYQTYGLEHAGMVANVICFRSRMAVREVCRVFDLPLEKISYLIQAMGKEGLKRLMIEKEVCAKNIGLAQRDLFHMLKWATQLKGFPRHLGIHSGGFVISHQPLHQLVPLEKATMENRFVIQWNKDDVEALGLMKVDLLALGMLTVVQKALALLKYHKNLDFSLDTVPKEDPETYAMLSRADAIGVFQVESRAQMNLLPRLRPKTYYDLVIQVAIVRPGPIQGGLVHPYLKRRHGEEKVRFAHPKLESILGRTLGVPLFQEQIMQIMMAVADFTPGEADQMRRILSNAWRKPSQIEGLRKRIEAGLFKNGVTPQDIEQIFKTIEGFASYGFPESHAASFALITYVSSYLKCHHHDVFTCALLNSQPMGFYPPRVLIQDAQKHGVKFLPLCVQHSDWDYTLEREPPKNTPWLSIREGFRALRGIKKELALRLIENRKKFGHFADFFDLIKRLKLSKQETQFLIRSGTLKCFHTDSAQLLWQLGKIDFHHDSLFWFRPIPSPHSTLDLEDSVATPIENEWEVKLPKKSDGQKLKESYLVKGYDLESHPLKLYRSELRKKGFLSSQELLRFSNPHHGKPVRVAGMVSLKQRPPTAKGVSFLTLEDEFGLMNIVLMPPIYERYRVLLEQASFLSVFGELEVKDSIRHIRAKQLHPFSS